MVKRTEKSGSGCYRLVSSKDKMVEDSEDCEDILDKPDRCEEETEGVKEEVKEEQQGHHRRGGRVKSKFNCFGAGMRERTPPP